MDLPAGYRNSKAEDKAASLLQYGLPLSEPQLEQLRINAVLEITVSHWPFSDQFQHLADQNPFWSAIFPVHFQWDNNQ